MNQNKETNDKVDSNNNLNCKNASHSLIKNELIGNIQNKLLNLSNDKSAILLLENFHSFFVTDELTRLAIQFLNELLYTRKKLE